MKIKEIRRQNLRLLAKEVGGITLLAEKLDRTQGQISHLISKHPTKNVGDRLAADIEKIFDKSEGWLDQIHFDPIQTDSQLVDVPVITWHDLIKMTALPDYVSLIVEDDSMSAEAGISFVEGGRIIVATNAALRDGCFVIASSREMEKPILRQYIKDGAIPYLKALNPHYPRIELKKFITLLGIVIHLIYDLLE